MLKVLSSLNVVFFFKSINRTHLKTNIKYVFFFLMSLKLCSINLSHWIALPKLFFTLFDAQFTGGNTHDPLEESIGISPPHLVYLEKIK